MGYSDDAVADEVDCAVAPLPAQGGEANPRRLEAAVDCEGLFWTQTADLGESTQGGETQLLAGTPQLRERLGDRLPHPEHAVEALTGPSLGFAGSSACPVSG